MLRELPQVVVFDQHLPAVVIAGLPAPAAAVFARRIDAPPEIAKVAAESVATEIGPTPQDPAIGRFIALMLARTTSRAIDTR